jgi:arsenite oxidase small subunit
MPTGIAGAAKGLPAVQTTHPRMKIGTVSALREGVAVNFMYPSPKFGPSFLVKLGTEAGGGVGKGSDIVAFNGMCPHMGGPLIGMYKHEYKAVGPCPLHLTTFDLTRFGMIITGQATESLPQVTLELDGDDIYAVGFLGLVYGRNSNA